MQATFTITIQKAVGASLGLHISCENTARELLVEGIFPGGAVEEWNRLSVDGGPSRAIHPGDRIVEVNGITGDLGRM